LQALSWLSSRKHWIIPVGAAVAAYLLFGSWVWIIPSIALLLVGYCIGLFSGYYSGKKALQQIPEGRRELVKNVFGLVAERMPRTSYPYISNGSKLRRQNYVGPLSSIQLVYVDADELRRVSRLAKNTGRAICRADIYTLVPRTWAVYTRVGMRVYIRDKRGHITTRPATQEMLASGMGWMMTLSKPATDDQLRVLTEVLQAIRVAQK
jgi:hypothetical protein